MKCPKCGSETAKRNGRGRGWCLDGRHSFGIQPDTAAEQESEEARLARQGVAPAYGMTHPAPAGFEVSGVSSLYRPDGSMAAQWVKTRGDARLQQEIMEAAVAAMGEKLPRERPRAAPKACMSDLLNCYVVTDYHLGMLSWHEETGADWDTSIAEELLMKWFSAAIAQSPPAQVAIFAQLGDFLHWDGMDAVTPASKHLLDADGRFQKLVRVAIRAVRRIIGLLLERHHTVHVLQAEGNHDPASSIWMREWLAAIYADEPRVTVDVSPDPYYCYEWGATSLFFHHGHKRRLAQISSTFTAKFREVFGRTRHSYAHMGHLHHIDMKENSVMVVEQHRTLAAPDAYASRGGWMSGRDAQVITYHREHGEVGRVRVSSNMLQGEEAA